MIVYHFNNRKQQQHVAVVTTKKDITNFIINNIINDNFKILPSFSNVWIRLSVLK